MLLQPFISVIVAGFFRYDNPPVYIKSAHATRMRLTAFSFEAKLLASFSSSSLFSCQTRSSGAKHRVNQVDTFYNSSSSSFFPFCVSTLEGVPDPDPPDGAASNSVFKPEPAPKLTPSAE